MDNKSCSTVEVEEQVAGDIRSRIRKRRGADQEMVEEFLSSLDRGFCTRRSRRETPSFRKVELNENDSERIVGMKVKVYWPISRKWFQGIIGSFDARKGLHEINYDDGDEELLNLSRERFELEIKPSDGFTIKTESHAKKKARDSVDEKTNSGDEETTAEALKISSESVTCPAHANSATPGQIVHEQSDRKFSNRVKRPPPYLKDFVR